MSSQAELLDRITVRADVFGGKPIIRDMRIAVEHVLGMLAAGDTAETILREYPDLEPEDIHACLRFAGEEVDGGREVERMDWETCPAVERNPDKISGAWAFTGTRVPVHALFENLASGATIDEFVEWFPGVDKQQVQAVLEHEARALRKALAR